MSRTRNSEIYVKGYGKSITKENLKKWFKPFGKINCIQYKGPYSFIVIIVISLLGISRLL
jgi:RNA recognition motif-containing protein